MFWRAPSVRELADRAASFRREHERFLDLALRSGAPVPRIPLRRVDAGGFDGLVARPRGREVARRWWERALRRVPDAE